MSQLIAAVQSTARPSAWRQQLYTPEVGWWRKSSQFPEFADVSAGLAGDAPFSDLRFNVKRRSVPSAFKDKCYSFKMGTFTKAISTRVSRQVPFPSYPVSRNLCSPPTRRPDPATRTVPHRCGGGRSRSVCHSPAAVTQPERPPSISSTRALLRPLTRRSPGS